MENEVKKDNKSIYVIIIVVVALLALAVLLSGVLKPKEGNETTDNTQKPTEQQGQTETGTTTIIDEENNVEKTYNEETGVTVEEKKNTEVENKKITLDYNKCQTNSHETVNNITVSVENKLVNGKCQLQSIKINGTEVYNETANEEKVSYEVYGNSVVLFMNGDGRSILEVYNVKDGKVEKAFSEVNIEGYRIDSYRISNDKLLIDGIECGGQCGNPDTDNKYAEFEIKYENGQFGNKATLVGKRTSKVVYFAETDNCELTSETKLNGVTVKVTNKNVSSNKDGSNGTCEVQSILINGKEVKDGYGAGLDQYIRSYEIYDKNVILLTGNTNNLYLTIYSVDNNNVTKVISKTMIDNYRIESYYSRYSQIVISGTDCGEQCGLTPSLYPNGRYVIDYMNGAFLIPKMVEKFK